MQYIQLFCQQQGDTSTTGYLDLDLYKEEPIKITKSVLSVENITANNSAFSRTFRVPNTTTNGAFFKAVFNVNSLDFDATQRCPAYILVDGFNFISGNIQLVNIFRNDSEGKIEYEIIFLGEVSAFSTDVAPKDLSSLDLSDLTHELTYSNITLSWTGQLMNGNVVYPLAEYGYTYDPATKVPNQSTLTVYTGTTGPGGSIKGFTNSANPLQVEQFRPAIRAKYIWDKIFADAGYTYESDFLDSYFTTLYMISSNQAQALSVDDLAFEANQVRQSAFGNTQPLNGFFQQPFQQEVYDYSNSWFTNFYRVPATLPNYVFRISGQINYRATLSQPNSPMNFTVQMRVFRAGAFVSTVNTTAQVPFVSPFSTFGGINSFTGPGGTPYVQFAAPLQQGDVVIFRTNFPANTFNFARIYQLTVTGDSPNVIDPSGALPFQFKQIEFIKAINDRFKLVWEPDKLDPKKFYIEPYKDWVKGGVTRDWTDKLNENSDLKISPLFYTQPREWIYKDSEEGDIYNFQYQQANKETFGELKQDSNNQLITGTKEIKSLFAPLPLAPLANSNEFLIPHFAQDTETERQPIQIKPRLGFYNGLQTSPFTWYMDDDTGTAVAQNSYPVYSSFDSYPFDNTTFDLNWTNPPQFWDPTVIGFDGRTPNTAFTQYWQAWFDATYDPYSRIMEATFALDVTDVLDLNFNDKIFVKDAWWLVLEIQDFVLNQKNNVRVKLLKLGNLGINITAGEPSSGFKFFRHDGICYGTTACDACCCNVYSITLYSDNESFASSTYLFYDLAGTSPVISGYYSDGVNSFLATNGVITQVSSCSFLGCPCAAESAYEIIDVCQGDTICEVCCCGAGEISVWGSDPVLADSTKAWSSSGGDPLTPGKWYREFGSPYAVQIGNDGITIVQIAVCSACVCDELSDQLQEAIGTSENPACCIEGVTGSYGVNTVWTDTASFETATVFFYDPYRTLPVGPTGAEYVSNGEYYRAVTGGTAGPTGACTGFLPCSNRTMSVDLNHQNTSGSPCTMDTTMYITYDSQDYFWVTDASSTGGIYTDNFPVDYAPNSSFQFVSTFGATGNVNVDVQKDLVSIYNVNVATPASYTSPTFGPIGPTGNYDIYLTYSP